MDEKLHKVGKRLGDIRSLPDELKKELQSTKSGDLEMKIIDVLNDLEGVANIDEILVGLYKKFNEIKKRQLVANKLYRMSKEGSIKSVPKKKGVYALLE